MEMKSFIVRYENQARGGKGGNRGLLEYIAQIEGLSYEERINKEMGLYIKDEYQSWLELVAKYNLI